MPSTDSSLVINNWANFYDERELEVHARQFNDIVDQIQIHEIINEPNGKIYLTDSSH